MEDAVRAMRGRESETSEVAQAIVAGPSFEEFFIAQRGRLLQALIVIAQNRTEAEELLQDAFLKVWERWDRVAAMEDPVGFLYRVAMNLHRSRLRRAAVAIRRRVSTSSARDELAEVEAQDEAVRLLAGLTPRERSALVFTAFLGYSSEEAGRLMGIKASTVRVLTNRARASLRAHTEETT